MKTYRNGRYAVQIGTDGSISVKPGDWLSKFSAAIHNDFIHVYEYGRKNTAGQIQPITDINRLFAGETIYHIPTVAKAAHRSTPTPSKQLTNIQKKELTLAALQGEFKLRGENLKILSTVIDIVGYSDTALTLIGITGLIAEVSVLAIASSVTAIASVFLAPLGLMIGFVNAFESGQRTYGMRAVAYAITAWAFDDPISTESKQIIKNLKANGFTLERLDSYHKAWKKASEAARQHMEREVTKYQVSKKNLQILLKALGAGKSKDLCIVLLQGFEKEIVPGSAMTSWKNSYKITYPD